MLAAHAPQLLERKGVGPDTAATLLIAAGDNPERLHTEASFAALCGVSPIKASSGKTHRRRLNRGGDRHANCALHTIVLSRLRWDARSRAYVQRRITEAKTKREAIVKALEEMNRRHSQAELIKYFGKFESLMTNEEIEALDEEDWKSWTNTSKTYSFTKKKK